EAIVPSSVPLWLDIGRSFDAIVHGDPRGRASRKDDVRRVRRLGLESHIGGGTRDIERFRRDLYEPYARERFGDLCTPIPPHAFRHASRSGWLLLLQRNARTIGGAVLERWDADARILAFGVATDADVPTGLLLEACYCHAIRFAVDAGVR